MTSTPLHRPADFPLKALSLSIALAFTALLPVTSQAADSVNESASRNVNIGPGLLSQTLAQFAVAVGVPLSFDPTQLGNRQSPGLQGNYSVQSGFAQLLEGSGFELISTGGNG